MKRYLPLSARVSASRTGDAILPRKALASPATVLIGLAFICTVGCSNPRNTVIPANIDSGAISESVKKLSPEDRELFTGYFMRHAVGSKMGGLFGINEKPIPAGTTIGQGIDEQRAFLANQGARDAEAKALKEKVLKEREQAMNVMRSAVTVTLVSKRIVSVKGYSDIETDRNLEIVFAYRNNTDKSIVGVKGRADVNDLFGDELSGFAISNDATIAPGATITWTGSRSVRYGMNSSNDEKLGHLEDDKYKVVWNPKMVIFGDGTKLTAPNEG
jgi:hypothetical protein